MLATQMVTSTEQGTKGRARAQHHPMTGRPVAWRAGVGCGEKRVHSAFSAHSLSEQSANFKSQHDPIDLFLSAM